MTAQAENQTQKAIKVSELSAQNILGSLEFNVRTHLTYDNREKTDIDYSELNLDLGEKALRQALLANGVKNSDLNSGNYLSLSIKGSIIPSIIKEQSKEKALESLDLKLKSSEEEYQYAVTQKVIAALEPKKVLMPVALYEQTKNKLIESGMETVKKQIALVKADKEKMIHARFEEIEKQTSYQEVAISLLINNDNLPLVLYAKTGKFRNETGLAGANSTQSKIEELTYKNSLAERNTGTVSTGGILVGAQSKELPVTVTVEAYAFHDRLPFISANQYVQNSLLLEDSDYNRMKNWSQIDSGIVKLILSGQKWSAYIVDGQFDGDEALGAGASVQYGRNQTHVRYSSGRNYGADSVASIIQSVAISKNHNFFIEVENTNNEFNPAISLKNNKVSYRKYTLGYNYTSKTFEIKKCSVKFNSGISTSKLVHSKNINLETENEIQTEIKTGFEASCF